MSRNAVDRPFRRLIPVVVLLVLLASAIVPGFVVPQAVVAGPLPWTPDKEVDPDAYATFSPAMATDSDGHLWIAAEHYNANDNLYGIALYESTNRGITWTEMSSTYPGYELSNPDIAIDPYTDIVYTVYERSFTVSDYDIWYGIYTPGVAAVWGQVIDNDGDRDLDPSITCEYQYGLLNYLCVSYTCWVSSDDQDLMFAKSTDHGGTWVTTKLRGASDSDVYVESDITNAGGRIYLAYRHSTDYIPQDGEADIWVDVSSNYGGNWTQVKVVDNSPRGVSVPSVAATHGGGTVMVAFDYIYSASDVDVYYAYSTDSGVTWSSYSALVSTRLVEHMPSLTVDGWGSTSNSVYGKIHAVYTKKVDAGDYNVYYRSADYSTPTAWSPAQQVDDLTNVSNYPVAITTQERYDGWYPCVTWYDWRNLPGSVYYSTMSSCGTMAVNPIISDLAVSCGQTSTQNVDVSAWDGPVEGISVARTSGPTWLTASASSLGTVNPGSLQTFTITAAPPASTFGTFPYVVTVSNTCGTPSSVDVTGTITVSCDPEAVVEPAMQDVAQGGTFSVDILVDPSGHGVSGGEVNIAFDPSAMSASDIVHGDLLGAIPTVGTKVIDNTLGTLQYALTRQGTTYPPTPLGTFATITFTAKSAAGTYPIEMTSIGLDDETFQDIPGMLTLDGQVTVVGQGTTPPTVSTSIAADVGTTSATLNGNLSDLGTASSVQVSFEWGLTNGYGTPTTPQTRTGTGAFDSPLSGLTPGATYHFRAKAVGDGTAYGDDMTFTTNIVPNQQPNQPSNTAPTAGATGVSLTPIMEASAFSDPDDGDTHAASQWQIDDTPWDYQSPAFDSGMDITNLPSISVPYGKLTTSNLYWWRVRYQDNHGAWTDWSAETSFTTTGAPNQQPNQPGNAAPAGGATGVSLTPIMEASAFSDPDDGDSHAASQWQIDDDPWDFSSPAFDSGTDTTNLTSISVPSGKLTYSALYYWRVRYQDSHGAWSAWSEEAHFNTMSASTDSTPPTTPSVADDGVTTTSTSELHAVWTSSDAESGIVEYLYAVGTTTGGNDVLDWTSAGTATEMTITGVSLTPGEIYYISVKAKNGQGLWSEVGSSDGITVSADDGEPEPGGKGGTPFWVWILVALGLLGAGAGGFVFWQRSKTKSA